MTRFTKTARTALLLTIASSFLTLTPPAFAADGDSVPQARLATVGTDFTSAKSVARLKRHLRRTAFAICTADWDGKTLMSIDQRQCYVTAVHNGLAAIDTKGMEARRQTTTTMAAVLPQEQLTH